MSPAGRLPRASARGLLALLLGCCLAAQGAPLSGGERIYREGVLASGDALTGARIGSEPITGLAAACVTCHRPSGLGSAEGRIVVPPITGKYLFRPHATNVLDMSLPHVPGYSATREPYDPVTLARAIREGVAPNGRVLSYLMPRFALDDEAMASLTSYLSGLGNAAVPGVTDDTLHFATIITPDADPTERAGMLDVMEHFFADKNAFLRGGVRPLKSAREIEYRVTRRWQLHVWQLSGAPDQWGEQLQQFYRREPVFAVISGLGRRTWQPVHDFCQRMALPCLLPNAALPVVREADFYPVYFSRGVLLEADLMAGRISDQRGAGPARRVVQVFRRGDIGEEAAAALKSALPADTNVHLEALRGDPGNRTDVAQALRGLAQGEQVVLWLRPEDLAALPAQHAADNTLISGEMGGLEHAPLPPAWRASARMTYPFDLPSSRRVRMNYPLTWFKVRHIPVVAEQVQTDTYVACGILSETLSEMLDSFVQDYLVERLETMLSHRQVNGYYPRLSLAAGQRFASKGGSLVRFTGVEGPAIEADSEWMTP